MGLGDAALTNIQLCGVVAVACAAWNLFGDLYFIDFYLAHMDFKGFGTIDRVWRRTRLGNFAFDFDASHPPSLPLAPWVDPGFLASFFEFIFLNELDRPSPEKKDYPIPFDWIN